MPRRPLPAPLREIGFDQNLDQPRAARHDVPRRGGPHRALGDYFGKRPVVLRVRVLRLPDALHAGASTGSRARSTCCRSNPGNDFEIVTVSFDPRDTPATAAAKKARVPRALQAARRRGRLALPHRRSAVDRPAHESRRVPLRVGQGDEAVRAPDRRHRAHAGRPARALPLRHRVRPARSALRARRGVGGQGRHRRSTRCCSTAITTTRRPAATAWRSCARSASPAPPRCSRSARSSSSWCGARNAGEPRTLEHRQASSTALICGPAPRSSPKAPPRWPAASTRSISSSSAVAAFFSLLIAGLIVVLRGEVPPPRAGQRRRAHPRRHCCSRSPGSSSRSSSRW